MSDPRFLVIWAVADAYLEDDFLGARLICSVAAERCWPCRLRERKLGAWRSLWGVL